MKSAAIIQGPRDLGNSRTTRLFLLSVVTESIPRRRAVASAPFPSTRGPRRVNSESSIRHPGWPVVLASGIAIYFNAIALVTFSVFLKPLAQDFSWSREAVARAYGCLLLTAAACAPFLGLLLDRIGSRRVA